ncbi:hypothetical protein Tco_0414495 [Tanacetum coccineum]
MTPHRSHQYHLITLTTFVPLHLRTITPPSPSSLPPRGSENTTKVMFGWVDITTAAPQGVVLVANFLDILKHGKFATRIDENGKRCLNGKVLSSNDLNGTRFETGFELAFATLFDQDVQTFTRTMLLNLDQLEKQLDKEEFQEIGSFDAFRGKERQMQSKEGKVDSSKALNVGLVNTESSGTESAKQETSSRSWNDTYALDADIRLVSNEEPKAEVQLTVEHNVLANEQHHIVQSERIYDTYLLEKVDSNTTLDSTNMKNEKLHKKNEHLKQTYKDLYDSIKKTRVQTKDHNDSLIAQINSKTVENADLKAQIQEKVFADVALKNELRKLKENSVDTKFAKPSILGKPVLQPPRNQSVVKQPNAFKFERPNFSKPRFASQVDVNNILNSQEEYGSNDMAHNHYLEEARKKTQERNRNSKPSVMHTTSLQNTTNGSKPNPRSNNQISRSLPVSKSSCGMSNSVTLVNSRAKVQSPKFRNSIKPVEKKSNVNKPERWISKGYRLSPNKSSAVYEKTNTHRSCLRWKPTGRIFKTVGLRWVSTGKIFISSTTKIDCKPPNGSNKDITNLYECKQTLNVSAGNPDGDFRYSDTARPSWSDEVLKLKNFKKDYYTSFQDQEKYKHVSPKVTSTQEGKISQDDDKRLDLADDLKKAQDHIQIKLKEQAQA